MNLFCWKCGGQLEAEPNPRRSPTYACHNQYCKARFMFVTVLGNRALAILNE